MQPVLEGSSIDNALTFDVGLKELSFHTGLFTYYNVIHHFNQIAPRVCTLELFIIIIIIIIIINIMLYSAGTYDIGNEKNNEC